jgi:hypothetical protein
MRIIRKPGGARREPRERLRLAGALGIDEGPDQLWPEIQSWRHLLKTAGIDKMEAGPRVLGAPVCGEAAGRFPPAAAASSGIGNFPCRIVVEG